MRSGFTAAVQGISVLGMTMLVIPVNLLLLDGTFPGAGWVVPLLTTLLVFLGYVMQTVYAAWLRVRNSNDATAYDVHTFTRYHYTHAIVPILIAVGLSVLVMFLAKQYMPEYLYEVYLQQLYEGNPNAYLAEESLVPYLGAVLCFISQLAGIIIWFYPPVRLNSMYTMLWAMGILFVEFCLYMFTGGLVSHRDLQGVFVGCLTVFCICLTVLYNQGNLESTYRGSVVSVFKTEDRLYNVYLVLMLFAALAVVLVPSYVVVNGIYILGETIIWFILYRILYTSASEDPAKQYEYMEMAERHGEWFKKSNKGDFVSLVLGMVLAAVLLFIAIRTGWLKRIFLQFYGWLREVFGALLQKRNPVGHPEASFYQNYVDEKRKTQNALIRDYEKLAEDVHSYKEFLQQLSRLPDAGAQLCFAYAVLVQMYAKGNVNLKQSDTPREVEYKVLRAVSGEEIVPITAAFEKIKYAETDIPMEEATEVLHSICEIIHRYMV